MRLFRRNPKWPKSLERRQPQGAEERKRRDKDHRDRLLLAAQEAARITDENEDRIELVRAAMRGIGR